MNKEVEALIEIIVDLKQQVRELRARVEVLEAHVRLSASGNRRLIGEAESGESLLDRLDEATVARRSGGDAK